MAALAMAVPAEVCGNAHAHYSIGHGIPKVGTIVDMRTRLRGNGCIRFRLGFYKAAQQPDKAVDVKKYTSAHVKSNWIKLFIKGYPMKSFFDNGVNVTSHSDCPALSGSPDEGGLGGRKSLSLANRLLTC